VNGSDGYTSVKILGWAETIFAIGNNTSAVGASGIDNVRDSVTIRALFA
jgi:hypothetical protein